MTSRLFTCACLSVAACASGVEVSGPVQAAPEDSARDELPVADLLRAAESYAQQGRGERAVALARRALAKEPTGARAHAILGRGLMLQEQPEAAAAAFAQAITLGADDREAYTMLASCYDVARHYDDALRVYGSWLAAHPQDAEVRQERGLTLLIVERFDEAAEELARASRDAPDNAQIAEDLGFALLSAKRYAAALAVLEPLVKIDAARANSHLYIGQARAGLGDGQGALAALDQATGLASNDLRPWRARALLKIELDDAQGALLDWEHVLSEQSGDVGALVGSARAMILLDRLDGAQTALDQAWATLGDQPQLTLRIAEVAWRRGDRSALAQLRKGTTVGPLANEAWREIAAYAKRFGDKRLAAEAQKKRAE